MIRDCLLNLGLLEGLLTTELSLQPEMVFLNFLLICIFLSVWSTGFLHIFHCSQSWSWVVRYKGLPIFQNKAPNVPVFYGSCDSYIINFSRWFKNKKKKKKFLKGCWGVLSSVLRVGETWTWRWTGTKSELLCRGWAVVWAVSFCWVHGGKRIPEQVSLAPWTRDSAAALWEANCWSLVLSLGLAELRRLPPQPPAYLNWQVRK